MAEKKRLSKNHRRGILSLEMKISLTKKQIFRLRKFKSKIEKALKIKIFLASEFVDVEGEALQEYEAISVIKAVASGFDLKNSLMLCNEKYMLGEINIKDYVKQQRLREVRARVIGQKGRALKNMRELSGCDIHVCDSTIFILGLVEDVDFAEQAILKLIRGSKHTSVYRKLEQKPVFDDDLGLKE